MRKPATNHGVTLVELLVVMSIIAVLAAMLGLAVPAIGTLMQEAKAKSEVQKLAAVVELYRKDCGLYPDAINHDAGRSATAVPTREGGSSYPCSKGAGSRSLYQKYIDETVKEERQYSELVWTLGTNVKGWANPQLFEMFRYQQLNLIIKRDDGGRITDFAGGQLVDTFGRRLFYLSSVAYRNAGTRSGAVSGGLFMNVGTFQVYSAGANLSTGLDNINAGGKDKDDINNWSSMID